MISQVKANELINILTGAFNGTQDNDHSRWMGLCGTAPDAGTGKVDTEPDKPSYSRVRIANWESDGVYFKRKEAFFENANEGQAKNGKEIQFRTAKQAWTSDEDLSDKLKYWFISNTDEGVATCWGEIKSPLLEGEPDNDDGSDDSNAFFEVVTSDKFTLDENGYYAYHMPVDYNFPIEVGDDARVIIKVLEEGKTEPVEVIYPRTSIFSRAPDLKWKLVELNGVSYIQLGDLIDEEPGVFRDDRDYYPFTFLYHQVGEGVLSEAELIIYRPTNEEFVFNIYEVGIRVPRNTVATFYEKQIQIKIDSEDDTEKQEG